MSKAAVGQPGLREGGQTGTADGGSGVSMQTCLWRGKFERQHLCLQLCSHAVYFQGLFLLRGTGQIYKGVNKNDGSKISDGT
jgi:hypothetical protein